MNENHSRPNVTVQNQELEEPFEKHTEFDFHPIQSENVAQSELEFISENSHEAQISKDEDQYSVALNPIYLNKIQI